MVRMDDQVTYQAFLTLMWARAKGIDTTSSDVISSIVKQAVDYWSRNRDPKQRDSTHALVDIVNQVNIKNMFNETNMNELLEQMGASIHGGFRRNSEHDGDLIEALVSALKMNRGCNVLSGKVLNKLRKAILIPDELVGLKDSLRKGDMACGDCGRELTTGEMLSLLKNDDNQHIVVCAGCATPSYVQNHQKGEKKVSIPEEIRSSIKKLVARAPEIEVKEDKDAEPINIEEFLDDPDDGIEEDEVWSAVDEVDDDSVSSIPTPENPGLPNPPPFPAAGRMWRVREGGTEPAPTPSQSTNSIDWENIRLESQRILNRERERSNPVRIISNPQSPDGLYWTSETTLTTTEQGLDQLGNAASIINRNGIINQAQPIAEDRWQAFREASARVQVEETARIAREIGEDLRRRESEIFEDEPGRRIG